MVELPTSIASLTSTHERIFRRGGVIESVVERLVPFLIGVTSLFWISSCCPSEPEDVTVTSCRDIPPTSLRIQEDGISGTENGACRIDTWATWSDDASTVPLTCLRWLDDYCDCGLNRQGHAPLATLTHVRVEDRTTGEVIYEGPPLFTPACDHSIVTWPLGEGGGGGGGSD